MTGTMHDITLNNMTVHLVLAFGATATEVELDVMDPEACVADLTSGLDGGAADDLGLLVDGRWFGPDCGLDEVGFYEGAVVAIARRPTSPHRAARREPRLIASVIGGAHAGRTYGIGDGGAVIGRDPACDIVLDDESVSRQHASISASGEIVDLGSTNGTWIDDVAVLEPAVVAPEAVVRIGATHVRFDRPPRDDRPVGPTDGPVTPFNRPPRPARAPRPDPLVTPEAPKPSTTSRAFSVAMIIGPVLMGAGMVVIYGNPRFALFAALAPIIALVNWIASKRTSRKERRRRGRAFTATLERFALDVEARASAERARREEELTDPAEVVRRATAPSVKLWQRRPGDDDFLRLRAGLGRTPWCAAAPAGREAPPPEVVEVLDRHRALDRSPVEVDLSGNGVVGIVGERSAALALARSLVVQAAVHHGPADLGIAVLGAGEWDWTKWLPHLESDALADDLGERSLLVVVDDDASIKGRRAPVRQLLRKQSGIVIAETEDQLPSMCTTVITVTSDLGDAQLRQLQQRVSVDELLLAGLDDATARCVARSLARYEDPELPIASSAMSEVVRLLPLLGIDEPTPDAIRERWARDDVDPSPSTPIGYGDGGPVYVDLVHDGPHGLVGGTTGSGKSELLRSLVAGMAARVDPEHLVFVLIDYKGGSAFDECARLPHVVGLVTDLDEQLAERALRSLEAELQHREWLLRNAGVPDLPAYLRAGAPGGPLPRLVVVIDEFATMAAELPDFLGALVGIAQRGRSLGVHLLLATQRPSGAVNANIKANTNLRIALRVQDAADSTDLIERPHAATISRTTPGRAYLRRGPTDVVLAQTALSTAPHRAGTRAPVRVKPFRRSAPDEDTPEGDEGPSELTTLVDAIGAAFDGRRAPRRPWLPMLAERIELRAIEQGSPGLIAFAMADEPERQRHAPAGWVPADGHLALYGMVGSGTTTALLSVVEAVARTWTAEECHLYAIDYGSNGLASMQALPHTGAVIAAHEREAQGRLVRFLRAEVDRRRLTGESTPRIVTCIDGVGAFLAEHEGIESTELADAFRRVFSEGPAVGITFVVTADRVGALPLRFASLVSQKLLFRLADASDYSTLGLRATQLPRFVPGRAVHSDGNRVVQIGAPSDMRDLQGRRIAAPIGTLPAEVPVERLPPAQLGSPCRIPLGVSDDDLDVAWLSVHDGEHVLVAGPPRSGKTNALAVMAHAVRAADADAVLVAICEPRSPLHDVDAFDAVGTLLELQHIVRAACCDDRRWFIAVDDAPAVEDADGLLNAALRSGRPNLHVLAAGRADDVRGAYGHWLRVVRQSRAGVLLQPDLAADGDLLGVRLPRRLSVPLVPGRGFAVGSGRSALVQLVFAETA
jgi:DNA segregation ATPase FtsK/SpoIIIE, S-DNA-T family